MRASLIFLLLLQIYFSLCQFESYELLNLNTDKYFNIKHDDIKNKYVKHFDYGKTLNGNGEYNKENGKKDQEDNKHTSFEFEEIGKYRNYVGNPDDFGKIVRPCEGYDTYCIRKYFADHSKCKIANGRVPDPLYQAQNTIYFSRVNVTFHDIDIYLTGLNGRVEEFYMDPVTDNMVFAIKFQNLTISHKDAFAFHRKAQEPVIIDGYASVLFPTLTVTGIIPNINDLDLAKSEVTGYSEVAFPPFVISPSVLTSTDPQVQFALAEFLLNYPTDVQEFLLSSVQVIFSSFVQYHICDFNLKVL